ncbi:MAG TPA: V-type ATP synthase subunit D [bacterium]|nr:V-type ATP synthase subunit D [bacterium]
MELLKTRRRLALARRGHKLLKDKEEQLLVEFRRLLVRIRQERQEVEKTFLAFTAAVLSLRGSLTTDAWERLLMMPGVKVSLETGVEKIFNVPVRRLRLQTEVRPWPLPPANPAISLLLRDGCSLLSKLAALTDLESQLRSFSAEIERTRRRVNALEYVLIPGLQETIRFITFKLAETERAAIMRLKHLRLQ